MWPQQGTTKIYTWKYMLLVDDGNTIQLQLDDSTIHSSQVSIWHINFTCKKCAKYR
jgi:hypothetical protein